MIWKLFVHALGMVFRNIGPALRLSIVPFIGAVALGAAILMLFLVPLTGASYPPVPVTGATTIGYLLFLTVLIVAGLWVAVGWHRFVLMEEQPAGILPRWHGSCMASYLGRGLALGFLLILLPLFLFLVLLSTGFHVMVQGGGLLLAALTILGTLACFCAFYRLCPTLPAAAVGRKMTFGEAWEATQSAGFGPVFLTVTVGILSFLLNLPGAIMGDTVLGLILQLVAGWLMFMINLSIMTTIYGYFVEERDLVA
ncbi:hypothetical protein [Chachezhania antarctica]|uniref:hypothetical protein n=1 Tax=Chachezhania antarctica TaxID=2340860 RepID=UPI000EAFB0D7|nr:hypothetical protein [Chachezhania antarctica]|tara:strand:- start:2148 stop:2909 length:762 start_codon:yes stop_codon:yes gene_type:complete